jgi:hypothetical protein
MISAGRIQNPEARRQKAKNQKPGGRIQNPEGRKDFLLNSDFWLLDSSLKTAAPVRNEIEKH